VLLSRLRKARALTSHIYFYLNAFETFFYYDNPPLSIAACLLWQVVCSYPALLPSLPPLAVAALLRRTYLLRPDGVFCPPSFLLQAAALFLPRSLASLLFQPTTVQLPLPTMSQAQRVAGRAARAAEFEIRQTAATEAVTNFEWEVSQFGAEQAGQGSSLMLAWGGLTGSVAEAASSLVDSSLDTFQNAGESIMHGQARKVLRDTYTHVRARPGRRSIT
jgi:hypothetical protein